MRNSLMVLWVFAVLLLFNGCNLDNIDMGKMSDKINWNPEMVAPIAKANVTVWDLVKGATKNNVMGITKDPTGLIKIVYTQKNLFQYKGSDLIKFPVKENFSTGDKVLGDILPNDIHFSKNITLKDMAGQTNGAMSGIVAFDGKPVPFFPKILLPEIVTKFSLDDITNFQSLTLSKGTLQITLKNNLQVAITLLQGSFFDVGNGKEIKGFKFENVQPGETKVLSAEDVAGAQLSNQLEFRMTSFESPQSATPVLINVQDYFNLSFDLVGLSISSGKLQVKEPTPIQGSQGEFEFNFPDSGTKAFSAVIKKGTLSIGSRNTSQISGSVDLKLKEIIQKDGSPIVAHIPLGGNSTTIDLAGAAINFSSNPDSPYNSIPYEYSIVANSTPGYVDYYSTDSIRLDMKLNDIEFKSFSGDFGKQSITIAPNKFNMNVDLFDKIDGMLKLANPSLVLTIHNSMGIPALVEIGLQGSNKSGTQDTLLLNPPWFELPVPANINQGIITQNITFNNKNSNIVEFMALPPTGEIYYKGKIGFNMINPVTALNPNFLDMDATLNIDLGLELPLELQINKLGFKDTTSISGDNFKDIETVDLIVNAINEIPLDIDLQLLFVDTISKQQLGASKITKLLSAAKVDPSGKITSVESSQTFSLDKADMDKLRKANGLVFSGTLSSPNAGSTVAPLNSNSKINLNVVIKSKVNL